MPIVINSLRGGHRHTDIYMLRTKSISNQFLSNNTKYAHITVTCIPVSN